MKQEKISVGLSFTPGPWITGRKGSDPKARAKKYAKMLRQSGYKGVEIRDDGWNVTVYAYPMTEAEKDLL